MSIAITGFSGIAFALEKGAAGRWTEEERVRFASLVSTSLLAFAVSGVALLMLASNVAEARVWQVASAGDALAISLLLPRRIRALLAAPTVAEAHRIIWIFTAMTASVAVLLLANTLWLHSFWPLGTAVAYHLMAALISFVGLIVPPRDDEAGA